MSSQGSGRGRCRPRFRPADIAHRGLYDTLFVLVALTFLAAPVLGPRVLPAQTTLLSAIVLVGARGLTRPDRLASYALVGGLLVALALSRWVPGAVLVALVVSGGALTVRMVAAWPLVRSVRTFNAGHTDRALGLVSEILARRPRDWRACQVRSVIHRSMGRYADAEADARAAFTQACAAGRIFAFPHFKLGIHQFRTGDRQGALPLLRTAIRKRLPFPSESLLALHALAACLDASGDAAAAIDARRHMPRFPGAIEDLEREVADLPNHPFDAALRADIADLRSRLRAGRSGS